MATVTSKPRRVEKASAAPGVPDFATEAPSQDVPDRVELFRLGGHPVTVPAVVYVPAALRVLERTRGLNATAVRLELARELLTPEDLARLLAAAYLSPANWATIGRLLSTHLWGALEEDGPEGN